MCVAPRLREEFEELSAKEVEKSTRGALSATPPQDGPITKRSLRECIPPECFKRSYAKSLGHLAWDLLQVYLTYAAATYAAKCLPSALAPAVWLTYWFCQGLFLTALWVVAHECGHGGFTNSRLLNDLVGFSLHSSLLTPYFSWALTHAKHHHYTNHMSHGETWVPKELDPQKPSVVYAKTPLGTVQRIAIIFTVGWYAYLFNNATGAKQNKGQSHFNPHSRALFKPRDAPFVRASNAGMVAMLAVLGLCVRSFGLGAVVRVYLLPQMVANFYLCAITFMQHTHPDVPHCSPHFDGDEWTWLRGCLSTIDRTMGARVDAVLHHIVDSHVVHHIFSDMPFYGAKAATPYVKEKLGIYYKSVPPTPVLGSDYLGYWRDFYLNMRQTVTVGKEADGYLWFH